MPARTKLDAAQALYLEQVRQELLAAPHGSKNAVMEKAAKSLGLSPGSVHRLLKDRLGHDSGRQRRVDAGTRDVSRPELELLSAALMGTFRKTGARIMTFETAVDMLRTNGEISTTLSASRLATVLREQGLHPDQLTQPAPAIEQRSLHPNHVWQVDASVCVAYYLSNATGLQVMDEKKFYKNKPGNVTRIQAERLIRYAVADHFEHELLVRYYLGSECAVHLTDFLIWCMLPKQGHIVHGVPLILQMDMGSANTSAPTLNMLDRLQVKWMVHQRHNSRANGAVEKAHHIVEREFESALSFRNVASLDDLNDKALIWANHFGATKVHSRYGKPRHELWMTITAEQLRLAPDEALMRELPVTHPVDRRVSNNLTISFSVKGQGSLEFDVRYLPGVLGGAKVPVVVNVFKAPAIDVGYPDAETGELRWLTIEPIERGVDGRRVDAPIIGEQLRAAPRGQLERNRDAVLKLAYGGADAEEAALRKERGVRMFEGRVDPFKAAAEAALPAFLPRRGTPLGAVMREVQELRLTLVEAARRAKLELGQAYTKDVYAWLAETYPDGVPESALPTIVAHFAPTEGNNDGALRAAGGNA